MDAVKALRKDGRYEVVVMTATEYGGDYEIDGIKVCQFPRKRIGASEYFEWFLQVRNNRLFLEKLTQIGIRVEDVAVCHVHDYEHYVQYALEIKRRNPKCLTLAHHHFAGYYDLSVGKLGVVPIWSDLFYFWMRKELESVDVHIFISEHCKSCYGKRVDFDTGEDRGLLKRQLRLGRFYRGIILPQGYVLYNGVDKSVFKPRCGNEKLERRNELVIGCVGNFNPCKRQIDLIKAFELVLNDIPNARIRFVGSGKTYDECVGYVNSKGFADNVEFVEPMVREKLANFYQSIDLLVTPSVNEGFCCVNVESYYCSAPFISVRGLPAEEVLSKEGSDRWLFAAYDVNDMASKIIAYAKGRWKQELQIDLDINIQIKNFVDWIVSQKSV